MIRLPVYLAMFLTLLTNQALPNSQQAIERLTTYFAQKQHPQGHWNGDFKGGLATHATYFLLLEYFDRLPEIKRNSAVYHLLKARNSEGKWSQRPGGPSDLDTTGVVLKALNRLDPELTTSTLKLAWDWYQDNGGDTQLNFGTKLLLVPFGLVKPGVVDLLTPRILSMSSPNPFDIDKIGVFRSLIIPWTAFNYFHDLNRKKETIEKYPKKWVVEAGTHFSSFKAKFQSQKRLALGAVGWILERQIDDGSWYTYFHSLINLMALRKAQISGVQNLERPIKRGLEFVDTLWKGPLEHGFLQQVSTKGWDTPQALIGLNFLPTHSQLNMRRKAFDFLTETYINLPGDWSLSSPDLAPATWSFDGVNHFYPDTDVATATLEALIGTPMSWHTESVKSQIEKATLWVSALQNPDGGFPAWEYNTSKTFVFFYNLMFRNAPDFSDLSQVDVTSRILKYFSHLKKTPYAKLVNSKAIDKACRFLMRKRHTKNPLTWQGRWLVAYAYGTAEVLDGLLNAGCIDLETASRTLEWLGQIQNSDGGWGEATESFVSKRFMPAPSTSMQTTYVIQPFVTYERLYRQKWGVQSKHWSNTKKAINFISAQVLNGQLMQEESFTGVVAKNLWYVNYDLSPEYMALRNLLMLKNSGLLE